jgi:hypothetical protein
VREKLVETDDGERRVGNLAAALVVLKIFTPEFAKSAFSLFSSFHTVPLLEGDVRC